MLCLKLRIHVHKEREKKNSDENIYATKVDSGVLSIDSHIFAQTTSIDMNNH